MVTRERPIRYFSPDGEGMPNGCYIQRGGFLLKCCKNERSFELSGIAGGESASIGSRGGVLVFAVADGHIPHSIVPGHAFKGRYRDFVTGCEFGEESATLEVGGLSSRELKALAARMVTSWGSQTILVKDMNDGKLYLVDRGERTA